MKIVIKTLTEEKTSIEVEGDDSIQQVKQKIEETIQISTNDQRLIFAGKELQDDRTLNDCHIQRESVILVLNTRPSIQSKASKSEITRQFKKLKKVKERVYKEDRKSEPF